MKLSLENHTALITGASQGIGREIAIQLAKMGANIVITSNDEEKLYNVADEIRLFTKNIVVICADAALENELENIVIHAPSYFGNIDILINNVGNIGRLSHFEDYTTDEWFYLFKLNVMSGVLLSKHLVPTMKKNLWGRIVFISSEKATEPGINLTPYAMTKAALLSIAKSLANELGEYNITVNSISPGVIITPAWDENAKAANMSTVDFAAKCCESVLPKMSLGMPLDVANLVSYLCSDHARWITGSNFRVDGGSIKSIQT